MVLYICILLTLHVVHLHHIVHLLHVLYLHYKKGEGEKARDETSNAKATEIREFLHPENILQNNPFWIVHEEKEKDGGVEGEVGEEEDEL